MRAVTFGDSLEYRPDYPTPVPGPGEALIRVRLAGICNTDLEITRGYLGFQGVLGHEFVGEVAAVGPGGEGWLGGRVVGEINCACGECGCCRVGLGRHCPNRATLGIQGKDGCLADFATLPVVNLHRVPENLADEQAVFCEPLAAAWEILEQVHLQPTDRVLVLGDGKLGLLVALVLARVTTALQLAGKHPEKLALASRFGIPAVPTDHLTGEEYDVVVDATGSITGFQQALRHVRPRGTLVLKSTVAARRPVDLAPVVIREVTVVGSRCGPFAPALRQLAGGLDPGPLITAVYPAKEALEAFARAADRASLKVLVDFRNKE